MRPEFTQQSTAAERLVVNRQQRGNNRASAGVVWKKDESGSLSISTAGRHCRESQGQRGEGGRWHRARKGEQVKTETDRSQTSAVSGHHRNRSL